MSDELFSAEPGSWPLAMELLDRGDPAFVDEIRRVREPDRLASLARQWYHDPRPVARQLLCAYLDRPLNALRHEGLVKRLFKLAEDHGDDEIMGRFLVLLDRSLRRQRQTVTRWDRTRKETVAGEVAITPNQVMPRPEPADLVQLKQWQCENWPKLRLFTLPTRIYLRRRAWRYFRKLGRREGERYLDAMRALLPLYRDEDIGDGLGLLDNWGLVHILFQYSPALLARPTGWTLVSGHSLAEVEAAPYYLKHWKRSPHPLLELLNRAQTRTVRQWAIQLLRREHPGALQSVPLEQLVAWLEHPSGEMVALAVELLRTGPGLAQVDTGRLLTLLFRARGQSLELLCELLREYLTPQQVTIAQAVQMAQARSQSLAHLGFQLLQGHTISSPDDCQTLLGVAETECPSLRAEMVRWSCGVLSSAPHFSPLWAMEYLDSRFSEVRAEAWNWLQTEPRAGEDVTLWQRLLESPYDDVRLRMVAHLQTLTQGKTREERDLRALDGELVRLLWATVLLNVHRGARNKPVVVTQLMGRLTRRPEEAPFLLPLLGVALRSLRGPEFRAGLVSLVQWVRRHPEQQGLVQERFPELRLASIAEGCVGPDWSAFLQGVAR